MTNEKNSFCESHTAADLTAHKKENQANVHLKMKSFNFC